MSSRQSRAKVEDRFAPTFFYVPNTLRGLPTFRETRELAGFLRKSNIFNGIFLLLRFATARGGGGGGGRKKEGTRGITSDLCNESFVATSLGACSRFCRARARARTKSLLRARRTEHS